MVGKYHSQKLMIHQNIWGRLQAHNSDWISQWQPLSVSHYSILPTVHTIRITCNVLLLGQHLEYCPACHLHHEENSAHNL